MKESLVWGETAQDGTVEICAKIVLDKETITAVVNSPDDENGIKKLLDHAIKRSTSICRHTRQSDIMFMVLKN